MPIITISRQYGSGGDEIASRICDLLDYRYFDKNLILKAAAEAGLSEAEFVDYSEEHHRSQNFLDRLFAPARPHDAANSHNGTADSGVLEEAQGVALVRTAIEAACRTGNMVILGRGGQVVLRDEPGVLHVRIEAPLELRALRVQDQHNLDLASALELIARRDSAAAGYLRRYYKVDWADPLLYHLVLNTGRLSLENAANLIRQAVQSLEPAPERIQ